MTRHPAFVGIAALALVAACSRPEPESPAETGEGSAAAPVAEPVDDALRAASEQVFGLPAPATVELEEARESLRHFRIRAPFDDILEFYRRQLPDAEVTRYERGAKVELADGRSVYIYRELGERDYLLTYFDGTQAASPEAGAAANSSAASERSALDEGFGSPAGDPANPGTGTAPANAPAGDAADPAAAPNVVDADPWAREPALPGRDEPPPLGFRVINRQMHPRVHAAQPTEPRPIDFVRGVREPRRNPDAQF